MISIRAARSRADNGEKRWLSVFGRFLHNRAGQAVRFVGIFFDNTERKLAEEALRESEEPLKASLGEKEVLLKEIHHRVKNNMQVVSSLVALQANELQDGAMCAVLENVTHRVRSMALVHEKLYQSADGVCLEPGPYPRSAPGADARRATPRRRGGLMQWRNRVYSYV